MRALVQRVSEASLRVDGRLVSEIGPGLVVLLCVVEDDGEEAARFLARKIANLRIFADYAGKMNRSLVDVGGAALVVSQFTLAADTRKGNRPSFVRAAAPERADPLYRLFCDELRALGVPVETGVFAAHMAVSLVNDGPVTIWLDTAEK